MGMKFDKLQRLELALMREAFELACLKAHLPMTDILLDGSSPHAQLASVIQMLVEQGITDPKFISDYAVATLRTRPVSDSDDDAESSIPFSKLFF